MSLEHGAAAVPASTDAHAHADSHRHGESVPPVAVDIYDTTLRDGSQQEGISLSVDDKLKVAEQLDHLGVAYIEGGWPGANPKDAEFFARAGSELTLRSATLVAFGSTRRAHSLASSDETLQGLVAAGTPAVCLVAKASDLHVSEALRTTLEEAVAMAADSVAYLRSQGLRVFLDAEHFFDGYRRDPDFALRVLTAAEEAGAETLVLCDTNGGSLPDEVESVVAEVRRRTSASLGVHFHNDSGLAVANTLAGVRAGATQVQGCVNGYGERAGNADLSAAIPNLSLKMGIGTIPAGRLERLTAVSHHIAEIVNIAPDPQQPYVGGAAFAHKAGLHTSAIARRSDAYEHVDPGLVGNGARFVVSELSGKSTVALKAAELGLDLDSDGLLAVLDTLKRLEHEGYHFEVADGSLELLMRSAAGEALRDLFQVESFRVITDWRADTAGVASGALTDSVGATGAATSATVAAATAGQLVHPWSTPGSLSTEATVKVHVGSERIVATSEGNGPVNALDSALRAAIGGAFPALRAMHLTDYRVRVLDTSEGTGATTRVLVDTADAEGNWSTIGVSENIIEASWQALVDSIVFGLVRAAAPSVPAGSAAGAVPPGATPPANTAAAATPPGNTAAGATPPGNAAAAGGEAALAGAVSA